MDASHVYVRAWALGCFHSLISTQTFRRALTAASRPVDSCAEVKCPFSDVTKSGRVWRNVPENGARSVQCPFSGRNQIWQSLDWGRCRKAMLGVGLGVKLRASLSGTFLQRKDVVNHCLEFGSECDWLTYFNSISRGTPCRITPVTVGQPGPASDQRFYRRRKRKHTEINQSLWQTAKGANVIVSLSQWRFNQLSVTNPKMTHTPGIIFSVAVSKHGA